MRSILHLTWPLYLYFNPYLVYRMCFRGGYQCGHDHVPGRIHRGEARVTMAGIIIGLYCGCVIAGQTALMLPAAALVINFLFVLLIMALTCEPTMYKPAISFLLCFVFAQSTPVPPEAFPMRSERRC